MVGRMDPGHHGAQVGCERAHGSLASVVVPQDGLQTGGATRELSSSGTYERRCSARVCKAKPGMRHEVDGQRRTGMRATRVAHCACA
jgi:hypothetical protein